MLFRSLLIKLSCARGVETGEALGCDCDRQWAVSWLYSRVWAGVYRVYRVDGGGGLVSSTVVECEYGGDGMEEVHTSSYPALL